ncbi:MAG TPA: protein-signal peptide and transmembrane prediction [Planctomycetota bacterium]|nr:protein-signal peptide and transmembrane prediction [Planctomycetota bacterium]
MLAGCATTSSPSEPLVLRARGAAGETTLRWDPRETALVVVDMWDDHWCRGAARRVAEMAPAVDAVVRRARSRGVLVVHAPSTCTGFYKDHPARKRAVEAAFAKTPAPLSTSQRWGTAWCWPDKAREPDLPIDDSDMGCDCATKCTIREAWTRQIAAIGIDAGDAITDDGQELWNLFAGRGIRNVAILGVHLNMCVLGRPFGIRQLVRLGLNVVLVRDLTDTMYNSRMRPRVDHHEGTALVVGHVEKHWCPSVQSVDLGAEEPFRFAR